MVEFEAYARRNAAGLLRFAVALTGDVDTAQDVVQEVLARAFSRWHVIRVLEHPHAYVRRMLVNETISWRRKWGRVEARPDDDLDAPTEDHGTAVDTRDALLAELATLPKMQRSAVVMRYFEDMADADIAAVLGCRAVTVRGYLHRALKTLRVQLTDPALSATERNRYAQ